MAVSSASEPTTCWDTNPSNLLAGSSQYLEVKTSLLLLFFLTFVLKEIWICHRFDCTAHVFTIHMYLSASREICLSATSIRANVWCMFDSQMCRCGACVTSGNGPYLRMRCPFQAQLLIGNCQLVDMLHQYHQLWGATKCFLLKISSKDVPPSLSSSTSEARPPWPECKMPLTMSPHPPLSACRQRVWPVYWTQPSPGLEFRPDLG